MLGPRGRATLRDVIFLHGEGGYLDELLVVVVGFAVLWAAVKLAGRNAQDDADAVDEEAADDVASLDAR